MKTFRYAVSGDALSPPPSANSSCEDLARVEKLQKALIEMKDPALLDAFQRESLIPAKDSDFQRIHDLAKELGFLDA